MRPDLVILDWSGSAAAAIEALRATRSRATPRCCCWSTTERSDPRGPAAGADERLAAPFSPLQLQVKLRACWAPRSSAGDRRSRVSDVAVIGGGIAGCATAALLAEAGAP